MFNNKNRESEEFYLHLEVLLKEIDNNLLTLPKRPEDLLKQIDISLAKSKGSSSWTARFEKFAFLITPTFADLRIRHQINRIQRIMDTSGNDSALIKDAMQHLDNMVFARTYGRICDAPVKKIVRAIANNGSMATHELRNLVINRCFNIDENGLVTVRQKNWIFSLGVLQILLATAGLLPPILIILFSSLEVGPKMLASLLYMVPYLLAIWTFNRYFFIPHKLIPRVQLLLPMQIIKNV